VPFQTLIDVASLRAHAGPIAIIDCRFDLMNPNAGRQAYLVGHIPTALYADLNQDLSAPVTPLSGRHPLPDPEILATALRHWGIGDDTQVVAYDESNGSFAARLWWLLRWLGHSSAAVLDGGIKAWISAGQPVTVGPESPPPKPAGARPFTFRVDAAAVLDAAAVVDLLGDADRLLVDARAADRYAGAVEPIDSVAGHIAGAVNHPFSTNLAADGRFLPADELRHRWQRQLGARQPSAVVAMCGSGITACHNLLSLEIAGLSGAKLYAGSWSEWIRDPRRPVAHGSDRQP
jgi:thiosulfate/3-mercaptopyruvate sulfurtransferase